MKLLAEQKATKFPFRGISIYNESNWVECSRHDKLEDTQRQLEIKSINMPYKNCLVATIGLLVMSGQGFPLFPLFPFGDHSVVCPQLPDLLNVNCIVSNYHRLNIALINTRQIAISSVCIKTNASN